MLRMFLALSLWLVHGLALAALAVAQSGNATGASTTPGATINVTEAANQTLVVCMGVDDTTAGGQSAAMTYDSVALTELVDVSDPGVNLWVGILKNPNSGSDLALAGTIANSRGWAIAWMVLNDNDQTTANDTPDTNSAATVTSLSRSTASGAAGDILIACGTVDNKTTAGTAPGSADGQTEITEASTGAVYIGASQSAANGGDLATSWTWTGNSNGTIAAINFNAVAAGGSVVPVIHQQMSSLPEAANDDEFEIQANAR